MLTRANCVEAIKKFRSRFGIEASDENVIATIHLMNAHSVDVNAALDQSSRGANDHGIDAWYFTDSDETLFIFQSKLSESKSLALKGLKDLARARYWIEQVMIAGQVEKVPDNHCLFNLYTKLSRVRATLRKIRFVLISPFDRVELEDSDEFEEFERELVKTKLNVLIHGRGGKLIADIAQFNLEQGIPQNVKIYPIPKIPDARIELRRNAHLDIAFVTLNSLVELYRQRGDVLFDKNVRLSLMHNKDARERLLNPMESTLHLIVSGKINPSIFPFYHIGVTIAASASSTEEANVLQLEAPSIINGCQTITIANEYLKGLERAREETAIDLFKQIKVLAKVVVGTSNEELKEITNSNNRQNPIENWQLFSNEPIHIELEATLKDIGVFYERQRGKFEAVMKSAENAKDYWATNGTYIKVMDLGQIAALSKQNLQWAAKPSEIFLNKENHDKIFDRSITRYPRDIVFVSNLFKAMKRALTNFVDRPNQINSNAPIIFKKAIVRHHVYRLALFDFYQDDSRESTRDEFSATLTKIASPRLVSEIEEFYQRVVTKTRNWYTAESKNLTVEISKRKMDAFFETLAGELGISLSDGGIPFTASGLDAQVAKARKTAR